jgi:hypothetical protein
MIVTVCKLKIVENNGIKKSEQKIKLKVLNSRLSNNN